MVSDLVQSLNCFLFSSLVRIITLCFWCLESLAVRQSRSSKWSATMKQDDVDMLYRRMILQKTGQLKPEILVLCSEMNIEPESLKPKTVQEIKE